MPRVVAISEFASCKVFAAGEFPSMKLVIEKQAARRMRDLPPKVRAALLGRLNAIATDPFGNHPQVTAIKGEKDAFRLRQGDWRAVYRIDRAARSMHVRLIEPRGERTYR